MNEITAVIVLAVAAIALGALIWSSEALRYGLLYLLIGLTLFATTMSVFVAIEVLFLR